MMIQYYSCLLILEKILKVFFTFPGLYAASEWTIALPSNPSILKKNQIFKILFSNNKIV